MTDADRKVVVEEHAKDCEKIRNQCVQLVNQVSTQIGLPDLRGNVLNLKRGFSPQFIKYRQFPEDVPMYIFKNDRVRPHPTSKARGFAYVFVGELVLMLTRLHAFYDDLEGDDADIKKSINKFTKIIKKGVGSAKLKG